MKTHLLAAILTVALLSAANAQAADAPDPGRVAVLDFASADLKGPQISELSDLVGATINAHGGLGVADDGEVHRAIARREAGNPDCMIDEHCRTDLGRDVGAGLIVVGMLNKDGDGFVLRMDLFSTTGKPAKHASEHMKKLKSVEQNVKICLTRLFGWESSPSPSPAPTLAPPPMEEGMQSFVVPAVIEPPPPMESARKRVIVLPIAGVGIDAAEIAPLSNLVAAEVSKHSEFDVASSDDLSSVASLQTAKGRVGCAEDTACLTEISRKLNADLVVHGTVGKVGREYILTLAISDPNGVETTRQASRTASKLEDLQAESRACVASLFGAASAPPPAARRGMKQSFAIFDLKPTGLTPQIAQSLTQVLSTEVKSIDGASVVSREDIDALLQLDKVKMQSGCDDDGCMATIGGALGVDRLITGDAGKVGSRYLVNLRLIDVRKGVVEGRVTETFQGEEEQLLHAVRKAARDLLGVPPRAKGNIAITTSERGARVYLDREREGSAPVLVTDVEAGKHTVTVAANGFFDWRGDVYADPMETTNVWTQLRQRPLPWFQEWWVWTIVGGVLVGGAATATGIALNHPPTTGNIAVKLGTGAVP